MAAGGVIREGCRGCRHRRNCRRGSLVRGCEFAIRFLVSVCVESETPATKPTVASRPHCEPDLPVGFAPPSAIRVEDARGFGPGPADRHVLMKSADAHFRSSARRDRKLDARFGMATQEIWLLEPHLTTQAHSARPDSADAVGGRCAGSPVSVRASSTGSAPSFRRDPRQSVEAGPV